MSKKFDWLIKNRILIPGDIVLVHSNKKVAPVSDAIEWFENGDVSHVFMYVGSGGTTILDVRWHNGVHEGRLYTYLHDEYELTIRRRKDMTVEQVEQLKVAAYKYVGSRYDFLAVIGAGFRQLIRKLGMRGWLRDDFYFLDSPSRVNCSEFIERVYQQIGVVLVPTKKAPDVTPHDLLKTDRLTTIHE